MATPLYPITEKLVSDAWVRLNNEQLTPWAFFNADGVHVQDFHGRGINVSGIAFSGSIQSLFWSGYVEPFIEDIVERVLAATIQNSKDRQIEQRSSLAEAAGLLKSLSANAFARMADIDRRLRGGGFPESVALRSTSAELAAMHDYIDRRLSAEFGSGGTWQIIE